MKPYLNHFLSPPSPNDALTWRELSFQTTITPISEIASSVFTGLTEEKEAWLALFLPTVSLHTSALEPLGALRVTVTQYVLHYLTAQLA